MRGVYLILVVVFVAATIIRGIQDRKMVTITFLGFGLRTPLAILTAVAYVLGGFSGGSQYALPRKSVRDSRLASVP
jgi:putative membrane protein